MSVEADAAAHEAASTALLEAEARALAEAQRDLARAQRGATPFKPPHFSPRLDRALKHMRGASTGESALRRASEWFLDNYYLVRRVARQVEEELPTGFVRHLPLLASGAARERPRIDSLARALVDKSSAAVDPITLRRFIDAYQEVSPLTIAELWALPTMLRAAVLDRLLESLHALGVPLDDADSDEPAPAQLDADIDVERSVHALRVLDALDWKAFFEVTSRTEAVLRSDPALVYARMDFETCDSYRNVVEALAWATERTEEDVASLAIDLARGEESDPRRGHVGYYLVAEGRSALEEKLHYRAVGLERVRRAVTRRPTTAYFVLLTLFTALPAVALGWLLARVVAPDTVPLAWTAVVLIVALIPVSAVAVALLQLVLARLLPPRTLPKIRLHGGLARRGADARRHPDAPRP